MDNIFGGLEKFGLNLDDMGDLFSEEKPEEKPEDKPQADKPDDTPTEE